MAFQKPGQMPTRIERVEITLVNQLSDDGETTKSALYRLIVMDQAGNRMRYPNDAGNLVPHLTPQEITQLQAFMASLRARAESAILG